MLQAVRLLPGSGFERGVIVATGIQTSLELGRGIHNLTLRVTDDEGGVGTNTVVIEVRRRRP